MRPILIRARLAGPVIDAGHPIHLDGLLALAWVRRHARQVPGVGVITRETPLSELPMPHLPLGLVTLDGRSLWVASAAIMSEPVSPAAVWQTKRRDVEDWDRLELPVSVTAGPAKDCMLRRAGLLSREVMWLAWGVRAEIRRSLKLLWGPEDSPHGQIGSVRRSGSGQITRWSIEIGEHAPADCLLRSGRIVRHVPRAWLTAVESPCWGACRPPYWHPGRQEDTVTVGTEAQVHQELIEALHVLEASSRAR